MTHCQSSHDDPCDPVINRFALRRLFHGLFPLEQIDAVNQLPSDGCVICIVVNFWQRSFRSNQADIAWYSVLVIRLAI